MSFLRRSFTPSARPQRAITLTCCGLLGLLVLSEVAVRVCGLTDFPIYIVDPQIGYLPAPSQSGSFMRRHDWAFNNRSMGVAEPWEGHGRLNLLLIGNSIVMGGNPYRSEDRLPALLQHALGASPMVWPIAAGGWSTVNEVVYLQTNDDVAASADIFVWEYMAGGLSQLSTWRGEYVFPDRRPLWGTGYLLRRYVVPRVIDVNPSELPPVGTPKPAYLADFDSELARLTQSAAKKHPGILLLYPSQSEYATARRGGEWLPERAALERLAKEHALTLIDLAQESAWGASLYRDGTHPTAHGNQVLAAILARAIQSALRHT